MAAVTPKELLAWLKERVECPGWATGKVDMTKDKTICVYGGGQPLAAVHNVGGGAGTYRPAHFRVLVRWGKAYGPALAKAEEVYAALAGAKGPIAGKMAYINHRFAQPQSLGTSDDGVYEHAVEIEMTTER